MITKEQIARINALARKSREQGLTPEEKAEQAELRALYIESVKANLTAQLENTVIQTPDGVQHRLNKRGKP